MFDRVVVEDRSATLPETPLILSPDRPRAYIPIFSNRGYGKDSEVKLFEGGTQATLIRRYGTPNLSTTLAPLYYAHEFLRGGGDVYVRRIVSKTSTHSHVVILAKCRVVEDEQLEVVYTLESIQNATNLEDLISEAEGLLNLTEDVDGYVTYPVAVVGLYWTGVEGNKYTFRLLPNKNLEKVIDERAYQLEVRQSATSTPLTVEFSSDPDAMMDGESIFSNDIFPETSPDVFFEMLSTANAFIDFARDFVPAGEEYPDIFFGKAKDGTSYANFLIDNTSVDFTSVGGISLAEGSDGNFATTEATRHENMMQELVDSFEEDETAILENEYKYFVDYVFDFGAPQEVKDALVGFANRRQSTKAIIDTSFEKSKTGILNMRRTGSLTYDNEKVTIVAGVAATRDPFSNKKILMPLSYFEAFAVPNHIVTYEGGSRAFAGARYVYDNMLDGSYQPYFYNENEDIVEQLVDNRVNFAFDDINGYSAFHQSTSMKMNSALVERNNVHLLHLIIRTCLLAAKAERWNFAEDSDIEKYEEAINTRVGIELEGKLGEFELTAEREGTIGPARNRVAVTATVRFKYINKGTSFKFIVV